MDFIGEMLANMRSDPDVRAFGINPSRWVGCFDVDLHIKRNAESHERAEIYAYKNTQYRSTIVTCPILNPSIIVSLLAHWHYVSLIYRMLAGFQSRRCCDNGEWFFY